MQLPARCGTPSQSLLPPSAGWPLGLISTSSIQPLLFQIRACKLPTHQASLINTSLHLDLVTLLLLAISPRLSLIRVRCLVTLPCPFFSFLPWASLISSRSKNSTLIPQKFSLILIRFFNRTFTSSFLRPSRPRASSSSLLSPSCFPFPLDSSYSFPDTYATYSQDFRLRVLIRLHLDFVAGPSLPTRPRETSHPHCYLLLFFLFLSTLLRCAMAHLFIAAHLVIIFD